MANSGSIVLVSSDPQLARSLAEQLQLCDGLTVTILSTGAAAMEAVDSTHALWLVDHMLSDMSAAQLLQKMRERHQAIPAIVLAGAEEPAAEAPLDGDDHIQRPWRLRFLLSRIEAHLEKSDEIGRERIQVGPYDLRPAEKMLIERVSERRIRLTEKEVAILAFLAAAVTPTSRESLLNEVWGYQAGVTSHTLETHVYRLRQKIETNPSNAAILLNEAGGYRLAS